MAPPCCLYERFCQISSLLINIYEMNLNTFVTIMQVFFNVFPRHNSYKRRKLAIYADLSLAWRDGKRVIRAEHFRFESSEFTLLFANCNGFVIKLSWKGIYRSKSRRYIFIIAIKVEIISSVAFLDWQYIIDFLRNSIFSVRSERKRCGFVERTRRFFLKETQVSGTFLAA